MWFFQIFSWNKEVIQRDVKCVSQLAGGAFLKMLKFSTDILNICEFSSGQDTLNFDCPNANRFPWVTQPYFLTGTVKLVASYFLEFS